VSPTELAPGWFEALLGELRKIPAFFRRDLFVMWSYRLAFFSDWINLIAQLVVFYYVAKLVDPRNLPSYNGVAPTYMEFVGVGIALTSFMQVALGRVVSAIRTEQLQGTLEALLVTPTSPATIQIGSVVYDLAYIPIRTVTFLVMAAFFFGIHYFASGLLPVCVILLVFIPSIWGLGILGAAATLTFRRGSGIVGFGASVLTLTSGSYFPVELFPGWMQVLIRPNPITIALNASREALIGGVGWSQVLPAVLSLVPFMVLFLGMGVIAWRWALRRERRKGTIGLY
jgi:ABC-2 type transport system permease protein